MYASQNSLFHIRANNINDIQGTEGSYENYIEKAKKKLYSTVFTKIIHNNKEHGDMMITTITSNTN